MHKLVRRFTPAAAIFALLAVHSLSAEEAKPKTTTPVVVYKIQPQYTEEAKAAKVQGSVLLKVLVDERGNAQDVQVARSLDQGLDQNAVEAVKQWRFSPATTDGKPVSVSANIEVNFKLQ
jgi:TonB family protein